MNVCGSLASMADPVSTPIQVMFRLSVGDATSE